MLTASQRRIYKLTTITSREFALIEQITARDYQHSRETRLGEEIIEFIESVSLGIA